MKSEIFCDFSDKVLAIVAAFCILTGFALICLVVYSLMPSTCTLNTKQETVQKVPISGVYDLVRVDDNYKDYLLAMDIPHTAVDILAISSEKMVIKTLEPDDKWINMKTITKWSSRETEFQLNTPYNISYGGGQGRGVLYNYCEKQDGNIINCRSEDPRRQWMFNFTLIFTAEGLINKRYFLSKNIGTEKIYSRRV